MNEEAPVMSRGFPFLHEHRKDARRTGREALAAMRAKRRGEA
jgi:hypothetical protein